MAYACMTSMDVNELCTPMARDIFLTDVRIKESEEENPNPLLMENQSRGCRAVGPHTVCHTWSLKQSSARYSTTVQRDGDAASSHAPH